jgi:hypothetical protein
MNARSARPSGDRMNPMIRDVMCWKKRKLDCGVVQSTPGDMSIYIFNASLKMSYRIEL